MAEDKEKQEKLKMLELTIAKLDKAYGKGTVMRLNGDKVEDLSLIHISEPTRH